MGLLEVDNTRESITKEREANIAYVFTSVGELKKKILR